MSSPISPTSAGSAGLNGGSSSQNNTIVVRRELRKYACDLFEYTLRKLDETTGGAGVNPDGGERTSPVGSMTSLSEKTNGVAGAVKVADD